jgi:YD repeat-containing protein
MVAIVSGNNVGLINTSAGTLGQNGVFGNASNGNAGDTAYVNVFSGNLLLQDQDDFVAARGVSVALARTYNSQGMLNSGSGQGWQLGLRKQITGLTGTVNTVGSSVTRIDGDGSAMLYKYDVARAAYVSTDGGGAFQTLVYNAASPQWTWRSDHNDLQGIFELYSASTGLITSVNDQIGLRHSYFYTGNLLSRVHDDNGDDTYFDYLNNNLSQIRTVLSGTSTDYTRVSYAYDTANRLKTVTVDLTPENKLDAKTYVTTYTYVGATSQVETLTQSDGTSLSFTYELRDGKNKVTSVTDAAGRKTSFDYSVAGKTTVSDLHNFKTVYAYDAQGQLLSVTAPAIGGVSQVTRFEYDPANGNVLKSIDARGLTTDYGYDTNGNRILERDSNGLTVTRLFSAANLLLSETRYTDVYTAGVNPTKAMTTRYVYDTANRLRFVVGAEGGVDEYRYNVLGQRNLSLSYLDSKIAAGSAESAYAFDAMVAWSQTTAVKNGNASRTDIGFDARGLVNKTTTHAVTLGAAVAAPAVTADTGVVQFVYDVAGQLIQSIDAFNNATSYTYDGLGRRLTSTDALQNVVLRTYDDAGNRVVTRRADGVTSTSVYDKAGQLISTAQAEAGGAVVGTSSYLYDTRGHLRNATDPNGNRSYLLYDDAGRKVADITAAGSMTEYRYDADNNLLQTIVYATPVVPAALAALVDGSGKPKIVTLETAGVRPVTSSADQREWRLYDNSNRLLKTVDALGAVTDYSYDGASRAIQSVKRATPVDVAVFAANPVAANASPAASTADRITRNAYDKDGLLRYTLDAEGYITEFRYDAAGRQVQSIQYATPAAAATRVAAEWQAVAIVTSVNDVSTATVYDGRGLVVSSTDGAGNATVNKYDGMGQLLTSTKAGIVTRFVYDKLGRMIEQHADANGLNATSKIAYDSQGNKIAVTDAAGATSNFVYDANNRVVFAIDPLGNVSENRYDAGGNVIETVRYAKAIDPTRVNTLDVSSNTFAGIDGLMTGSYAAIDTTKSYKVRARVRQVSGSGKVYVGVATKDVNGLELKNATGSAYSYPGIASFPLTADMGWKEFEGTITGESALGQYDKYKFLSGSKSAAPLLLYNYGGLNGADGSAKVEVDYFELIDVATGTVLNLNSQMTSGTTNWTGAVGSSNSLSAATVTKMLADVGAGGVSDFKRYDSAGRQTWSVDAAGKATQLFYDAKGNVTSQLAYTQALSTAAMTVLSQNRSAQPTPTSGFNATNFIYDANDRLVFTVDPLGAVSETKYDAVGNVIETVRYAKALDPSLFNSTATYSGQTKDIYGANYADIDVTKVYTVRARVRQLSGEGNVYLGVATKDQAGTLITNVGGATFAYAGEQARKLTTAMGWTVMEGTITGQYPASQGSYDRNKFFTGSKTAAPIFFYNYAVAGGTDTTPPTVEIDYIELLDANGQVLNQNSAMYNGTAGWTGGTGVANRMSVASLRSLLDTTSADNARTLQRYDDNGRLIWSIDASGAATRIAYDGFGNAVSRTVYTQVLGAAALAALAADPAMAPAPGGTSTVTKFIYDANGRLVYTIDALGAVTENKYDANGRVLDTIRYATLSPALVAAVAPDMTTLVKAPSQDTHELKRYDALGRLTWTVDPSGAATQLCYDLKGNLVSRIAYSDTLSSTTVLALAGDAAKMPVGSANFSATNYVYDADNRLVFTIDPLGAVNEMRYDALGNVIETVRYTTALDPKLLKTTDSSTLIANVQGGYITGAVSAIDTARTYKVRARVRQVSGQGKIYMGVQTFNSSMQVLSNNGAYSYPGGWVTVKAADGWQTMEGEISGVYNSTVDASINNRFLAGSVKATPLLLYNYEGVTLTDGAPKVEIDYIEFIDVATGQILNPNSSMAQGLPGWNAQTGVATTLDVNKVKALLGVNADAAHEYKRYDKNGRLTWNVDASGAATQITYDAQGNAIIRASYSVPLNGAQLAALAGDASAIPAPTGAVDRTRYVYDADNRLVFTVDPLGAVTESVYSAEGQVVRQVKYATPINPDAVSDTLKLAGTSYPRLDGSSAAVDTNKTYAVRIRARQLSGKGSVYLGVTMKDAQGNAINNTYSSYSYANSRILTPEMGWQEFEGSISGTYAAGVTGMQFNKFFVGTASAAPLVLYNHYGNTATDGSMDFEVDYVEFVDTATGTVLNRNAGMTTGADGWVGNVTGVNLSTHALSVADMRDLLRPSAQDSQQIQRYDNNGRLIWSVDPSGAATQMCYDGQGNLISRISYTTPLDAAAMDRLVANPAAIPAVTAGFSATQYVYDAKQRLVFTIDALGAVTENKYDRDGNVVDQVRYANPVSSLIASATDGQTMTYTGTNGYLLGTKVAIDVNRTYSVRLRVRQVVGTGYLYMGVEAYGANGATLGNPYAGGANSYAAAKGILMNPGMGWQEFEGKITGSFIPAAGAYDAHKFFAGTTTAGPLLIYNNPGTGEGANPPQVEVDYIEIIDVATGQILNQNSSFAAGNSGWVASVGLYNGLDEAEVRGLLAPTATAATHQIQRYDSNGRLIWSVDPTGAATQMCYDAQGNVITRINYTTPLDAAAMARLAANPLALPVVRGGSSATSYRYDADNRLTHTIDATGGVTEARYDALGNVVETIRYAKPVDALRLGTTDRSTLFATQIASITNNGVVAIDTAKTYRVRARVRQVSGVGTFYLGVVSYNSASQPIVNTLGSNYSYAGGSIRVTAADGWQMMEGEITGSYAVTATNYDPNKFFAGSTKATPLLLYNYSGQTLADGAPKVEVDYIEFIDVATGQILNPNSAMAEGKTTWNAASGVVNTMDAATFQGLLTPGASDAHGFKRYDKNGRLIWNVDPNGAVTQYNYDADGKPTSRLAYTTPLSAAAMTAMADQPNVMPAPSGTSDATRSFYDAADRLIYSVDALGAVTEYRYDTLGRVTDTVRYAKVLAAPLTNASDLASVKTMVAAIKNDLADAHQLQRYDASGRLNWSVDSVGAVTKLSYNADGKITSRQAYTTALTKAAMDVLIASGSALPAPVGAANTSSYVYDADAHLVYTVDAVGAVSENVYDGKDNVVETVRYAKALNPLAIAGLSLAAVKNLIQVDARDIHQLQRFDNDNRLIWSINALGAVTERQYDAAGRVSKTIAYGNALQRTLAPGALPTAGATVPATGAYVLTSTQDRVTTYVYDAAGRVTGQTDAAGTSFASTQSWAYDVAGNVIRHTDGRDSVTWSAYDAGNRLVRSIDALGFVTTRTYYADDKVKTETRYTKPVALPATPNNAWAYDVATTPVVDPDPVSGDQQQSWTYDADGRMQSFTDALGGVTKYIYDSLGNLTDSTVAFGSGAAATTHLTYDQGSRVVSETRAFGTGDASTVTYGYDTWGNQTSIMAGGTTTYQRFDAAGRKYSVTDADGGITSTYFNTFGDIVKVVDARGNTGYFYPDALGRVVMQVDPEGAVSETRYDLRGNATHTIRYKNKVQGPVNETTVPTVVTSGGTGVFVLQTQDDQYQQSYYDPLGRKSSMRTYYVDTAYYNESYTYDGNGNMRTMTSRNGAVTTYDYDKNNRLISEILPVTSKNASNVEVAVQNRLEYDARGNVNKRIEAYGLPEQRITTYVFDKLNRQTKEIGAAVNTFDPVSKANLLVTPVKERKYDVRGNVIEEVDARGGRTLHFYDRADREVGRVDPAGTYTRNVYDIAGMKQSQTIYATAVQVVGGGAIANNAAPVLLIPGAALPASGAYVRIDAVNDRTTLFTYDGVGRVKTTTVENMFYGSYKAGNYLKLTGSIVTTNFYDATGNLIKSKDGNGNETRNYYDKAGNLVGMLDAARYLTVILRDSFGNIDTQTSYATAVGAGVVVTDATTLAQLTVQGSADDRVTRYTYDRMGRTATESRLGVAYGTIDGTSGALTDMIGAATTTYAYDGLSNVTRKTDANNAVTDWEYDALGRKKRELQASFTDYRNTSVRTTVDYEYNGLDQVKRQLVRGENDAVETDDRITSYEYSAGFLSAHVDATMARTELRIDAAGNVTRKTLVGRVNADGLLVNDVTDFWYDALNREVRHTDGTTSTTVETRYNGFGEITGKRTNPVSQNAAWAEFSDYDRMGRAWRSNVGDGITRVYVYDANGNATLKMDNADIDLRDSLPGDPVPRTWTLATIMGLGGLNQTASVFDVRNQLTDTYQPKMVGGHGIVMVDASLTQQGGTSFAGIGGVTMGVPAGLGNTAIASLPDTPGSATIARTQNVTASLTDRYIVSTPYYGDKVISLAEHTFAFNVPDTSAWGSGAVRIDFNLASSGQLGGYLQSYYPPSGASNASYTFTEEIEQDGNGMQAGPRSFTYTMYKEGTDSLVKLGTYTWQRPTPANGTVMVGSTIATGANVIHLSAQKSETALVVMMTRPAGSNGGWIMTRVPQVMIGGVAQVGQFDLDWSGMTRGNYEFRYVAFNQSNDIVNSEEGTMTLSDSAPTIAQTKRMMGGAGRAFVDASGNFVFNELGGLAATATLSYRPVGSNAAPTVVQLGGTAVGGSALPGWFSFSPAGLSGNYEYTIESKTIGGATLIKSTSTFTAGATLTVNDPSGVAVQSAPLASVNLIARGPATVTATLSRSVVIRQVIIGPGEYGDKSDNPSTTLTIQMPDTSAWGTGQVRVAMTLDASGGWGDTYSGYGGSVLVDSAAQERIFSMPTTAAGAGGMYEANYSYALYKQTPEGEVLVASYGGASASATPRAGSGGSTIWSSTGDASAPLQQGDMLVFNVQPTAQPATRLLLEYRPQGSTGGWQVMSVSPQFASLPQLGRFRLQTSLLGANGASMEYRTVVFDASGNVLQTGAGLVVLGTTFTRPPDQADMIGGGGRVFMDNLGRLNFTEQGINTTKLTIRYRAKGSADLWSTRATLTPANVGGAVTPGWFVFTPPAGVSGALEYVIEGRNGADQVLAKTAGSFTPGVALVSALSGYTEPLVVTHFQSQPLSAVTMRLKYKESGAGSYTEIMVSKASPGVFDWVSGNVFASDTINKTYDYIYESFDGNGVLVNKAHGGVTLGLNNAVTSHVNEAIPTIASFAVPKDNTVAATATRLELKYRKAGTSDAFVSISIDRVGNVPFLWDASALVPPGTSGSVEYSYTLKNGSTVLTRDNGDPIQIKGTVSFGPSSAADRLNWYEAGSTSTEALIHHNQHYNAFGEVDAETDARNYTTNLAYNTLGKMVRKDDPSVSVTLANGFQSVITPRTSYVYDRIGRTLATRDANGNLVTQTMLGAGNLQGREFHADGGAKSNGYDIFGDVRYSIDEIGLRTDYSYDKAGRLTLMRRPLRTDGARAEVVMTYDQAGNRITQAAAPDATATLASYTNKTYYDSLGRVTQILTPAGRSSTTSYVWDANIKSTGGRVTGGWRQTITDPMGRTVVDDNDAFGRTTAHKDLGGHTFVYNFNTAGWLGSQTGSTGQNIVYTYYANGYVKSISDKALKSDTEYEYDAVGNRTYEAYRRDVGGKTEYLQNSSMEYDSNGRVTRITDPRAEIRYEYDAVGNRRRVYSSYHDGVDGSVQVQDLWYDYDKMNRFTVTMGKLSSANGARGVSAADTGVWITTGPWNGEGVAVSYNLAGQRIKTIAARDGHREDYSYGAEGYLETTFSSTNAAVKGAMISQRVNDRLGRTTGYMEYQTPGAASLERTTVYDADGRQVTQTGTEGTTTYSYYNEKMADGSDSMAGVSSTGKGELAVVVTTKEGAANIRNVTSYDYWDGARQRSQTTYGETPYRAQTGWRPGKSYLTYDVNGHLASALDVGKDEKIDTEDDVTFTYVSNAQGLVLRREQSKGVTIGMTHRYMYLNGAMVGDVGNDGDTRLDYAQMMARTAPNREEMYKNWRPVSSADFDQNYEAITASYPAATGSSYTAKAGETLYSIAGAVWGDVSMWYLIADANGLTADTVLVAGQTLTIPNKVTNIHNNSGTMRPYNAGAIIGDVSPTMPDAPLPAMPNQAPGCGVVGQIIVIVIVAIVCYYAGPQVAAMVGNAFGAASPFIAAGITAAIGNAAGQVAAMAMGMQEKFNWRSVGTSALAGALLPSADFLGTSPEQLAAAAAIRNIGSQAISNLTGEQKGFDWSSVAVSAISAPMMSSIKKEIGDSEWGKANLNSGLVVGNTAAALVSATVRMAVVGGRMSWGAVAGDAIGGYVGDRLNYKLPSEDQPMRPLELKEINLPLSNQEKFSDLSFVKVPTSLVNDAGSSDLTRNVAADEDTKVAKNIVIAKKGDSISSLVGSGDPQKIGNFMSENGLKNSQIFAGREYSIPENSEEHGDQRSLGERTLRTDNATREASLDRAYQREQDMEAAKMRAFVNDKMGQAGKYAVRKPDEYVPEELSLLDSAFKKFDDYRTRDYEVKLGGGAYAGLGGDVEGTIVMNLSDLKRWSIKEFEYGVGVGIGFETKVKFNGYSRPSFTSERADMPFQLTGSMGLDAPFGAEQEAGTFGIGVKGGLEAQAGPFVVGAEAKAGFQSPIKGQTVSRNWYYSSQVNAKVVTQIAIGGALKINLLNETIKAPESTKAPSPQSGKNGG